MEGLDRNWDVIVIGTGMGGATLGHALARKGLAVLFCERGRSHLGAAAQDSLTGAFAETFDEDPWSDPARLEDLLRRGGRLSEPVEDRSHPRRRAFIPFMGCGTGGSSALYGMALERFHPSDFVPLRHHPGAPETTLPESWPVSYAELEPYYHRAEVLYRVRGEADPLRGEHAGHLLAPARPLSASQQEMYDFLAARGLHPYRLHMACEELPGCRHCQSYLCPRPCKNDSARICLRPALEEHGATLLDECRVVSLTAAAGSVTGVNCVRHGEPMVLRGRIVVLAAGALQSPAILLRSASPDWPQGLANRSGLVGRNLMRHYVDLYVVTPRNRQGHADKALAFNDFYTVGGRKLGSVQSFGELPPAAVLAENLRQDIRHGPAPWLSGPFRLLRPLATAFLRRLGERGLVLASVMEDLPYADNRVLLAEGGLAIQYRIRPYEAERIRTMRALLKDSLAPLRPMLIRQAENNAQLAHACGTCRFGTDPATSVLDPDCRAHGLDNLYVVDASFFPSSGGANPALTIAANALRVSERIV